MEYKPNSKLMLEDLGYVKTYDDNKTEERYFNKNTNENIIIFKSNSDISFSKFHRYYDGNAKEFLESRLINTDKELDAILQRVKEIKESRDNIFCVNDSTKGDLNDVINTIKMIHAFNRDLDIYYCLHNEKSPYEPSLGLDEEDRKQFDCGKYTVYAFEDRNSQKPYKLQGLHVHILNLSDTDAEILKDYCIKEGYTKSDHITYDRGPHND